VRKYAPYTRFSAKVAREICARVAAGESQAAVCADPRMPEVTTLRRWALRHGRFGRALARSRALGGHVGTGPASGFDEGIANEIVARLSLGETLTSIGDDPAMPSGRTIFLWRQLHPEFGEAVRLAREVVAERFGDLGWKLAMEATPETAYLTHVRLAQLRWTASLMSPQTHGRMKPMEPPGPPEPVRPRERLTLLIKHYKIEEHPETGMHRVATYEPDPDTLQPVRTSVGEWRAPLGKTAEIPPHPANVALSARQLAEDPEGWR
jgi:hypothetical protein